MSMLSLILFRFKIFFFLDLGGASKKKKYARIKRNTLYKIHLRAPGFIFIFLFKESSVVSRRGKDIKAPPIYVKKNKQKKKEHERKK